MKKILTLLFVVAVFVVMTISTADASPYKIPFGDSVNYWEGWGNNTGDDNNDVVGNPNIKDKVEGRHNNYAKISESGYLEKVHFVYKKSDTTLNAGSLFIDISANSTLDYVLQPALQELNTTVNTIYKLTKPLPLNTQSGYILSNVFHSGGYRENHPVAIDPFDSLLGAEEFGNSFKLTEFKKGSGWDHVRFYDFSIDLEGQDFIIGFGPTCANDVIYETVNNPVPIPTTLLLFGSGLIGLVSIKRRRR